MAVNFNGDGDYLNCGTGVSCPSVITISAWVAWGGKQNYNTIIAKRNSWGSDEWQVWTGTSGSGNAGKIAMGYSGGFWYTNYVFTQDEITHVVAIIRDDDGVDELWINGAQQGIATIAKIGSATTAVVNVGANQNGNESWDGYINEVAVWDIALTAGEISLLFNSKLKRMPLQIQPANLKLYLPMDDHPEGAGINTAVFRDLSGNGNDGTGVDADGDSTIESETVLSYPQDIGYVDAIAAVTTKIKKVSGVAYANIKKIAGVAIDKVKKVSGVEN